jgi:predicted ATPase
MKIAVSGTHNTGKTTYIADFIKKWPMYETCDTSYRDLIKSEKLKHSKDGTEETQKIILDYLVEQAIQSSKKDFAILDRCVLDNLAYSTWLNLKGLVSDKFLDQSRILVRETLKMFDVIFFTPLTRVSEIPLENNEVRDLDPVYREEIDNIFKAFTESYHRGDGRIFPKGDSPPIIEIFGSPEERIKLTEFYIREDGKCFGEEESLIIPATM